ncbi:MAG: uracil-DNA glycosylase [Saprospiraceae bacterium]
MTKLVNDVKIEESWKNLLHEEFQQPYFSAIKSFLLQAKEEGKVVYPSGSLIFNAFNTTPVEQVKVVIIGQDPYHGPNQAMGLSFSVPKTEKIPSSLRNIFKELETDIEGFQKPTHGDLTKWAEQGVFLLNACLTVEHKTANAHKNIGWHQFTDAVIRKLSEERTGLVFLLWGNFAKKKKALIDTTKHHVLESVHPSGLSAHRGFFGCKHFSQTNELLEAQGTSPIDWNI